MTYMNSTVTKKMLYVLKWTHIFTKYAFLAHGLLRRKIENLNEEKVMHIYCTYLSFPCTYTVAHALEGSQASQIVIVVYWRGALPLHEWHLRTYAHHSLGFRLHRSEAKKASVQAGKSMVRGSNLCQKFGV